VGLQQFPKVAGLAAATITDAPQFFRLQTCCSVEKRLQLKGVWTVESKMGQILHSSLAVKSREGWAK